MEPGRATAPLREEYEKIYIEKYDNIYLSAGRYAMDLEVTPRVKQPLAAVP